MSQGTKPKETVYYFPPLETGRTVPVVVAAFGINETLDLTVIPFITSAYLGFKCQVCERQAYRVFSHESRSVLGIFQAAEMASLGAVAIRCGPSGDMNSASDLLAVVEGTASSDQLERTMEDFGIDDDDEFHHLLETSRGFFPSPMDAIAIMGKLSDKQMEEFARSLKQAADDGRYRGYGKLVTEYVSERLHSGNELSGGRDTAPRRSLFRSLLSILRG